MVEKWLMYHSEQMTLLSPCKDEKGRQLKTAFVYFTLKRGFYSYCGWQKFIFDKSKKGIIESYVTSNLISNTILMQ